MHLFAASRAELVRAVIRPALDAGRWVVSDRFLDSSLAYQGVARGLGIDAVLEVNRAAVEGCLPDLSLVIDMPTAVATPRAAAPRPDRIEAEGEGFHARVAEGYRELAARFPERVRLVSGEGEPRRGARARDARGGGAAVIEIPGQPLAERILRAALADEQPAPAAPAASARPAPASAPPPSRRPGPDGPRGRARAHRRRPST